MNSRGEEPPEDHNPRYIYDCVQCKFNWCCGPMCECVVERDNLPMCPDWRKKEVNAALKKAGCAIEFLPNGKRERGR